MDFDFYVNDFKQRLVTLYQDFVGRILENDVIMTLNIDLESQQAGKQYHIAINSNNTAINSTSDSVNIEKTIFGDGLLLNGIPVNGTLFLPENKAIDIVLTDSNGVVNLNNVLFTSSDDNIFFITSDGTNSIIPRTVGNATLTVIRPAHTETFTISIMPAILEGDYAE